MSKKVPELRFKGFTDDWEQRKLGEVGNTFTGLSGKTKEDFGHGEGKFITYVNVFNNPVADLDGLESVEIDNKQFQVKAGDVLFTTSSETPEEVGMSSMWLGNADNIYLNSFCFGYRPTIEFDNYYLAFMLRSASIRKKFQLLAQGISRYNISKNKVMEMSIPVPSIEEQQKIGAFFKQLDDTIALYQRKLDLLKEQKKGFLQKMFPKNGAKVPELRFKGFTDDWEERKLSGIIEKLSGGASIKPTDYLEDGIRTIPKGAVNATGIADLSGSKYISEDFFEKNITSHAHTSNLVTSLRDLVPSAPNMGRIVRIEGDDEQFLMPQGVYKLELFEGMDEDFLISFSNSDKYRKIISAEKNGSTQVHIRNGEFLNIDINLPSEHEQKKIGSFFKQLDNTIALHQRKLDLLKEQKKGFLQKMFV